MNLRRILPALVVVLTLVAAGSVQPLIDKTRASAQGTNAAAPPVNPIPGETPVGGPPGSARDITTLSGAVGAPSNGQVTPQQAAGVGPVDQNAPLDFSTQPAGVPRVYVPGRLYNVQVYKKYGYGQLLGQMNYFASSLGVGCQYCHNLKNFAYDTPTKKLARSMAIMTNSVASNWVDPVHKDYPNYAVTGAVGCVTCHRGQPRMDVKWNVVPVQYLTYRYKSTKQVGYAVNSMYSAARSLGVNCLFCHNSADFISLQYYPTNQIALRMWKMVDAINHQYLPANVKAVTCYTCHQGAKWPQALVTAGLDQTPVEARATHPEVHENPGAHLASGAPQ